jgi:hypothetical protein
VTDIKAKKWYYPDLKVSVCLKKLNRQTIDNTTEAVGQIILLAGLKDNFFK